MKKNNTKITSASHLRVLFEDNHLLAVNKWPGDIVQADKTGDKPLSDYVKNHIKSKFNKPGDVFLGTVHRIDRPVSGLVIYARTSKALERLNEMFKDKTVQKIYWAIVQGTPPEQKATLTQHISRNTEKNKAHITNFAQPGTKECSLTYEVVGKGDRYTFVKVLLHTGRHHQIRAQLSAIGCPIKGDLKYGAARSNPDGSISLHARSLTFIHPVRKEEITITAPTPDDNLWKAFPQEA